MRKILLLLFLYPFAEIASLAFMVHSKGVVFTLWWLFASAILGIIMLRNQQIGRLLTLGAIFKQGENISLYSMLWSLRYILAGVLFIIPGIISDIFAVLLLLPFKYSTTNRNDAQDFEFHYEQEQSDEIIQGEFTLKDEKIDDQTN